MKTDKNNSAAYHHIIRFNAFLFGSIGRFLNNEGGGIERLEYQASFSSLRGLCNLKC